MRIRHDVFVEGKAKAPPDMSKVGHKVGPNEVIARDGYVRRIMSVATRKRKGLPV